MRILLPVLALLFLATFAPPSLYAPAQPPKMSYVAFEPVPLNAEAPGQRRVGPLTYLGGWALRSNDFRFGGLSAMHIDGEDVLAMSDAGHAILFHLPERSRTSPVRFRVIAKGPRSSSSKRDGDIEAMAVAGRRVWLAFENNDAIWRYRREDWKAEAGSRPQPMKDWPHNQGGEAMVRLAGGRFLVFSEGEARPDGTTEVLLFASDPAEAGADFMSLGYRAPDGYRITDAALLPGGRILFLNRRVSILDGISAKLTIARLPELEEGAIISGAEIADFAPPVIADNMEALSVTRQNGRDLIWIASDNNFSPLQRTLLLKFALAD